MALFPGTPKEESRNCRGLESWDFGSSYFPAPTSNWSEVETKVVAFFESFSTPCCPPSAYVEKRSIPDF
jgi:hypothetical protein